MAKENKKPISEVRIIKKSGTSIGEIKSNGLPRFVNPSPTIKRPPKKDN